MDKEYQELEEEMVNFYNQSNSLFIEGSVLYETRALPYASIDKTKGEAIYTVFEFLPLHMTTPRTYGVKRLKRGRFASAIVMGIFAEHHKINVEAPKTTITVNTASDLFESFLKTFRGFELALLHAMIHLKNPGRGNENLMDLHTPSFTHVDACRLLASLYSSNEVNLTDFGPPEDYEFMHGHNILFITYCYYIAQNLMEHEELLTRVLDGDVLEGKNRYEKAKGLAKRIYWANHLDRSTYNHLGDNNILPDNHLSMDVVTKYVE